MIIIYIYHNEFLHYEEVRLIKTIFGICYKNKKINLCNSKLSIVKKKYIIFDNGDFINIIKL